MIQYVAASVQKLTHDSLYLSHFTTFETRNRFENLKKSHIAKIFIIQLVIQSSMSLLVFR